MSEEFNQKLLDELYKIITPNKIEMFERLVPLRTRYFTIVLENIFQEHNASAVLRTCESFGVQDLHVIEKDNKYKVQRDIARGAGRWVDMYNYSKGEHPTMECITALKNKGYKIIATTPHEDDFTVDTLPIDSPIALIFGTEQSGISDTVRAHADGFVKIPMYGFTESFNISVSAAISMHVIRQRLENSSLQWKLTPEEQLQLKINWCQKIIPRGHLVVPEIRKRLLA